MWLYTYNPDSAGSKLLSEALKVKRIKHENSKFVGKPSKVVINWGASEIPFVEVSKCRIINPPDKVGKATNKLHFFRAMAEATDGPRLPPWTTSIDTAYDWVHGDGKIVFARTKLNASGGAGIHIIESTDQFVNAALFTQYVPKKNEYRIHFVNGKIIDYQRKALRPDIDKNNVNWKVRNLDNGFIFVREGVELPQDVVLQAEKAIKAIDLDFGAIDIIYNEKAGQAYVLEVNTAPGLVGKTLESYAAAFEQYRTPNDNNTDE